MKHITNCLFTAFFLFICSVSVAQPQNSKQKQLEAKRLELQKEMKQINSLLFANKKKEQSVISEVEDLNYKVRVRNNLIKITNDQANLLTRKINSNQKKITDLRAQLTQLKKDYAAMLVTSYKSKSEQSRIMFLLSSENFKQAYKRLQYLKQYTDYQKQQGEDIKTKSTQLQELNTSLLKQKAEKNKLVKENRLAKKALEADLKTHEALMISIKKELSKYTLQIKSKQQEADKIDREIERLIKAAIAKSNKKAGKPVSSKKFELTAEAKVLAANFISNKGKLPWPVEKGIVVLRYGKQPSLIDKKVTIQSSGVRIATEKGAKIRAVFDGNVYAIIASKNGNPTVLVQHGNYFTAYKNLSKIYVKKGDKITTKQNIGEVFTSKSNGKSILNFSVFKNDKTENPSSWIYNM